MPANITKTAAPIQVAAFKRIENPDSPGGFDLYLHVDYMVNTNEDGLSWRRQVDRTLVGAQRTAALNFLSQIQTEVNTKEGL